MFTLRMQQEGRPHYNVTAPTGLWALFHALRKSPVVRCMTLLWEQEVIALYQAHDEESGCDDIQVYYVSEEQIASLERLIEHQHQENDTAKGRG